jgi:RND family efflux transporter MFP subunit
MNLKTLSPRSKLAGLVVLLVLAGAAFVSARKTKAPKAPAGAAAAAKGEAEPMSVGTFAVEKTTFTDTIDGLVGTVKGDTIELTYAGPEEQVIAVNVKLGQSVAKGQLLIELDHTRSEARKNQAEAAYRKAQSLAEAGGATEQDAVEAKSAYEIALRDWQDTFIRAPKAGTVSEINRQVGEVTSRNEPIAVVVSSQDRLMLETGVIESQIDRVAVGQQALVQIEAFGPEWIKATVQGVAREVTTTGRTGTVQIALPPQVQSKLRPGLSARCRIRTYSAYVHVIPRQAYDNDKNGVYIVEANRAVFRPVQLGHATPEYYAVTKGFEGGEHIVKDLIINPVEDNGKVAPNGDPDRYQPDEEKKG